MALIFFLFGGIYVTSHKTRGILDGVVGFLCRAPTCSTSLFFTTEGHSFLLQTHQRSRHALKALSFTLVPEQEDLIMTIEEEKKADDASVTHDETTMSFDYKPATVEAPKKEPTIPKTSTTSPSRPALRGVRFLFLDLPLFALLSLYGGVLLLEYAKEELFSSQYEGLLWDGGRRADEITYYTRICDENDITTTNPSDLFLPQNGTGVQGAGIMMRHGFTVVPNVVKPENAAKLRAYIDEKSRNLTPEEKIWLVKGKNRYSFNLGTEDPGVVEVLQDLGRHKILTEMLESLLGPDPAMIELTVITASYGAEDQWYHDDAVPDGSPSRYGIAFSPAYSLFVSLQNLTTKMGITSACPGTHFCAGGDLVKACNANGFQLADENGELSVGDTFLFNMNVWHRGAAHTDPEGNDRVMLIMSFVPRPKEEAETRQMVHGITYAMRWDMWGFTWRDFATASSTMVAPWTYLRALGLYKPKNAVWGLDYITSASMRATSTGNGFDLDKVGDAEITWLPKFLRLTKDEIDDDVTNAWFWFASDQILKLVKFFKKASFAGLLTYITLFSTFGLLTSQGFIPSVLGSVRRAALLCAMVAGIMYVMRRNVDSTQWAKDLKGRRRFFGAMRNQAFFDEEKDGPQSLPNIHDVLIESRYGYKDLGSYNDYLDYHMGNDHFLKHIDAVAPYYTSYPEEFKEMAARYIAETVVAKSGRFLEQGRHGRWYWADMETSIYFTKKILVSRSNGLIGAILKETRHLTSVMRYGIHRNEDIAFLAAPFLKGLMTKFLNACIGEKPKASMAGFARLPAMKPKYADDGITALRWKDAARQPSMPLIKIPKPASSLPESGAKRSLRQPRKKFVPTEPKEGAWIKSGDTVEGAVNKYWYVGTVHQISAHGNHLIKFVDGDEGLYDEYQIRRPVPFDVGQKVEVFAGEDEEEDTQLYDKAVIIAMEKDGKITVEIAGSDEVRTVPSTALRRKVTEKLQEKPGHSYSSYG